SPPANPSSPVAPGTQVTLTANCTNSPTSYSWSPGGGTTQSIVVAPTTSTQYFLTATNAGGANTLSYYLNVGTPMFSLTISGSITPTVANITASIQFRPQDVGTTASVYVFALAPASLVHGSVQKDGPCVLAQLDSSGQLQAASASSLQPYFSGTLS